MGVFDSEYRDPVLILDSQEIHPNWAVNVNGVFNANVNTNANGNQNANVNVNWNWNANVNWTSNSK